MRKVKHQGKTQLATVLALLVLAGGGAAIWFFLLRGETATDGPGEDPPAASEQWLVDHTREAGIRFQMNFLPNEQGETFKINLYDHGCGVAVGDVDGDGLEDIYFLNQLGSNALYRNLGNLKFEDVTEKYGVGLADRICVGASFADYDNDGDQDLYVTSTRGGNVLFRNDENQKLVDVTEAAGLTYVGHSQSAVFFDYDRDGLLDLYLTNTAGWTRPEFDETSKYFLGKGTPGSGLREVITSPVEHNILYRNQGDGTFVDVTEQAGLAGRGWTGDAAVVDYDEDGHLDVLVTCMFGPAQLYHNNGDGTFANVTGQTLVRSPFGGVGAKVFDYGNDGHLDLYIVDMHSDMWMGLDYDGTSLELAKKSEKLKYDSSFGPVLGTNPELQKEEQQMAEELRYSPAEVLFGNALYRSDGKGGFEEVSDQTNMETFWPWGVATGDFDSDGYEDVFIASGMGYPFYYWNNYLMMNDGSGVFRDQSFAWGIEPPPGSPFQDREIRGKKASRSSRCAASADFDGDGRLELVTNNFNDGPYFFRNQFPQRHYLAFELQGTVSNRDAVGAVVRVRIGDQTMVRQVHSSSGYLSQSSRRLHFGLGERTQVDQVEIRWPNGERQEFAIDGVDKLYRVVEPKP